MLLLDLVQEHGVDQVVGHRLGQAGLRVVEDEIGIDRGHLFGDEAILQGAGAAGVLGACNGRSPAGAASGRGWPRPCPGYLPCSGGRKLKCRAWPWPLIVT